MNVRIRFRERYKCPDCSWFKNHIPLKAYTITAFDDLRYTDGVGLCLPGFCIELYWGPQE